MESEKSTFAGGWNTQQGRRKRQEQGWRHINTFYNTKCYN